MIRKTVNEYEEGGLGVRDIKITFFGITVFRQRRTSTNRQIVSLLKVKDKTTTIKGFNQ